MRDSGLDVAFVTRTALEIRSADSISPPKLVWKHSIETLTPSSTGHQTRVPVFCDLCNAEFRLSRAKENGEMYSTNLTKRQGNKQCKDEGSSSPKINGLRGKY